MTVSKLPLRLTLIVCLSVGLCACGLFRRPAPYADSQESGRLVVPAELDRPSSDPSLALPPGGTAGTLLDADAQKPPEMGQLTNGTGGASLVAGGFPVSQPTADVYSSIGSSLESMPEYLIRSRDPVLGVYRVQVELSGQRRSWWKFWGPRAPKRGELVVRVGRTETGSEVGVDAATGGPAAAARASQLADSLRERLNG